MGKSFYDKVYEFNATAKGSQKRLATFLLRSPNEAALMTIEGMAEAVGVSAGMVSRAVRKMGFDGFAEMQRHIRKGMLKTLSPSGRLKKSSSSSSGAESLAQDARNLTAITTLNPDKNFRKASDLLIEAPRVHVMGLRSSYPLAYFLALCLEQLRDDVFLMDPATGRISEQITRLKPGDLAVLISFPRYLCDSLRMAQEARRAGCNLLAITDSLSAPLALQADAALVAPYEGASFFNSLVAPLSLVNALLTDVVAALGEKGAAALEHLADVQKRWNIMPDDNEAWNRE